MTKIFGICGWSGSGKTDLVCRLINYYVKKKLIVSTIKHTHHNFQIDKNDKDSFKHRLNGAHEVIIGGGNNFALIHTGIRKIDYGLSNLKKKLSKSNDLILVEGFKKKNIPKVEVFNSNLKKDMLWPDNKNIKALVYDRYHANLENCKLPKFKFEETKRIANFIANFLKISL